MHFCCNKLVDFSMIGKAKTCDGDTSKKSKKKCSNFQEEDCCSNQTIIKVADDTFTKTTTTLNSKTLFYVTTSPDSFATFLFCEFMRDENSFTVYRPPLLSIDAVILNETYLI